jgi:hypothetical protein
LHIKKNSGPSNADGIAVGVAMAIWPQFSPMPRARPSAYARSTPRVKSLTYAWRETA